MYEPKISYFPKSYFRPYMYNIGVCILSNYIIELDINSHTGFSLYRADLMQTYNN